MKICKVVTYSTSNVSNWKCLAWENVTGQFFHVVRSFHSIVRSFHRKSDRSKYKKSSKVFLICQVKFECKPQA